MTGNQCRQDSPSPVPRRELGAEGICLGYISATADLAIGSGIACPVKQRSYGDIEILVMNAMVAHPEQFDLAADLFILAVLSQKFPCKEKGTKAGKRDWPSQSGMQI